MPSFVTLAEAKMQTQVDTDALDPWFEMMLPAISGAVLSWLKEDWRAYEIQRDSNGQVVQDSDGPLPAVDTAGDPIVLPVVKAATLVELASQFRFRDGDGAAYVPSHWGHGYVLGVGATSLLAALRKSTIQ